MSDYIMHYCKISFKFIVRELSQGLCYAQIWPLVLRDAPLPF